MRLIVNNTYSTFEGSDVPQVVKDACEKTISTFKKINPDKCHKCESKDIVIQKESYICNNCKKEYSKTVREEKTVSLLTQYNGFPTGLAGIIYRTMKSNDEEIEIIDKRVRPVSNKYKTYKDVNVREQIDEAPEKFIKAGRGILLLATAAGKTRVATNIIAELGVKTIYIVPNKGLLTQTKKEIGEFVDTSIGLLGGDFRDIKETDSGYEVPNILISTVQSLWSIYKRDSKLFNYLVDTTHFLIFDEAHHVRYRQTKCKPKNSLILTPEGYRTFQELYKNEKEIITIQQKERISFSTKPQITKKELRRIYKIYLSNGLFLFGTFEHEHKIFNGAFTPINELKIGDKLETYYKDLHPEINSSSVSTKEYYNGIKWGWIYGDGYVSVDNNWKNHYQFGIAVGDKEFDCKSLLEKIFEKKLKPHSICKEKCLILHSHIDEENLKLIGYDINKNNLEWLYNKSAEFKYGFLQAVFTTDGSVSLKKNVVRLSSIHYNGLCVINHTLQEFGIYSSITTSNKKSKNFGNTLYELIICGSQFKRIGFLSKYKEEKLKEFSNINSKKLETHKKYVRVKKIEQISSEFTYDISVKDGEPYFIDSGVITHNSNSSMNWNSWYIIAMKFKNAYYRLGLTATVYNKNDLGRAMLEGATGTVQFEYNRAQAQEDNVVPPFEVWVYDVECKDVKGWRNSYKSGILENDEHEDGIVWGARKLVSDNRKVVILFDEIDSHLKKIEERLPEASVLVGKDNIKSRDEVKRLFIAGEIPIILSTVLSEGVNIPEIDGIVIAAGKGADDTVRIRFPQYVGRGSRHADGKTNLVVIDFFHKGNKTLEKHSSNRIKVYKELGGKIIYMGRVYSKKP